MRNCMKWMAVCVLVAVVTWVAAPARAYVDNVVIDPSTGELAEVYGRENFEGLNPGDSAFAGNLIDIGGTASTRDYLVNNDNPDLKGNHFDGDSSGAGGWSGFDINHSGYVADKVYLQGIFDDHGRNFSPGVLNHSGNTQFLVRYIDSRWELLGTQDTARSGTDIFDPSLPTVVTNVAELDFGFVLNISTTVYQPATGTSWSHSAPNSIPGFGTPVGASSTTAERRSPRTWTLMT